MPESTEIVELIDRARVAGDRAALEQLLNRYRNYLDLLARLHRVHQFQAKTGDSDLVQETCIRVAAQFDQFQGRTEQELTAWFRSVMACVSANLKRHFFDTKKRDCRREEQLMRRNLDESSAMMRVELMDNQVESPSQEVARREQAVLMADALKRLPKDYSEVIILHHFQGQPFEQVADSIQRSVVATRKLWSRALIRLRDELTE